MTCWRLFDHAKLKGGAQNESKWLPKSMRKWSVKTMPKQIIKPFENKLKSQPKNIAETHRNKIKNMIHFQIWVPIWEQVSCPFPTPACLYGDLVFGTFAGHPLDRFWSLPGNPRSDVPHSLNELRSHFALNVKDFKATFRYAVKQLHPTTPSTKHTRSQKHIPILNPNRSVFAYESNKPAQVRTPSVLFL